MAKEPLPYEPPKFEPADASAFQALRRGDASEAQQKRALEWFITASGTHDLDYRKDPRDHAFVSGRRFMGLQVIKMLKLNASKLVKPKE